MASAKGRSAVRRLRPYLARMAAVLIVGATAVTAAAGFAASATSPRWGLYTGPGPEGVSGAVQYTQWSGHVPDYVLDFAPSDTWEHIGNPTWLIEPYAAADIDLVLSVPLLPDDETSTLQQCADGMHDQNWRNLAQHLVRLGASDTVIRPGWEFNGWWYRWSARGLKEEFTGCFRRLVDVMRSVSDQQFRFDWNPNVGPGEFPAELAYPGDAYVDVIGVDVYDMSWTSYPFDPVDADKARVESWNYILHGDHGLRFWSDFARAHGKPMSIPEWGVVWRADGFGGGDNPFFIDAMLDFIEDPANNVEYAGYFNNADTEEIAHDIIRADTRFPDAAERYLSRVPAARPR